MKKQIISNIIKQFGKPMVLLVAGVLVISILASSMGPGIVKLTRKAIGNLTARIITVTTPAPVIVEKLQALNRLETARQIDRHVVEAKSESPMLPGFLFKDNLMMLVQTETVAGIDLSNLSEKDIRISGKSVTVHLPSPQIFYVRIDDQNSKVYSRERGWLVMNPDTDLERQARLRAQTDAREAAVKSEMLPNARANAETSLKALLRTLGFKHVEFKWGDSSSEEMILAKI